MDKKNLLVIFAGLFLVLSCWNVLAINMSIVTPVSNGNYSTTLNITVNTLNLNLTTSLTCYYNNTGAAILNSTYLATQMVNSSYNQSYFSNTTVDISGWDDEG